MRFLPHHFQSMERAAAWYPTSATPTFSRFHSQLVMTDVLGPTKILRTISMHAVCSVMQRYSRQKKASKQTND